MNWTDNDYNDWHKMVEFVSDHGTEEEMREIYTEIHDRGCSDEDLERMDSFYNRHFSIL